MTLCFCTYCGNCMWGVGKDQATRRIVVDAYFASFDDFILFILAPQGYQCISCQYIVHRNCVKSIEEPCIGEKKERRSFVSMDSFGLFGRKRSNNSPTASKLWLPTSLFLVCRVVQHFAATCSLCGVLNFLIARNRSAWLPVAFIAWVLWKRTVPCAVFSWSCKITCHRRWQILPTIFAFLVTLRKGTSSVQW